MRAAGPFFMTEYNPGHDKNNISPSRMPDGEIVRSDDISTGLPMGGDLFWLQTMDRNFLNIAYHRNQSLHHSYAPEKGWNLEAQFDACHPNTWDEETIKRHQKLSFPE